MSERPGDVLDGRYRLERRVGTGGTSDVWAATDQRLDRAVAVKVVRVDPDDAVAAQRGPAEARLLGRLSHPHLVSVHDARFPVGGESAPAYLVMELVEGGTLALALAAGPVAPARAREVVGDVASALAYMHGRDVIHRDVKPANILFARDGTAKLTDFGIARVLGSPGLTQTGLLMGTAPYLSPEQVRGAPPTPASDIYSLGLVLLEALTGTRAYPGTATESAIARLTRRPDVPATVPGDLRALVETMTADDPAARPAAADVAHRLGAGPSTAVADTPDTAPPAAPAATATAALPPAEIPTVAVRRPRRRPSLAWLAVPVAAALILVVVLIATSGHGSSPPVRPTPPPSAAVAGLTTASLPPATATPVTPVTPAAATPAGAPKPSANDNGKANGKDKGSAKGKPADKGKDKPSGPHG